MATAARVAPAMRSATMVARVVPANPGMSASGFFRAAEAVASSVTAPGSIPLGAGRRSEMPGPRRVVAASRRGRSHHRPAPLPGSGVGGERLASLAPDQADALEGGAVGEHGEHPE